MKNICFFTNRMTSGGSERVISYLANEFCKDYDVSILTMTCAKSDYYLDERVKHIPMEDKLSKNNHSILLNLKRINNLKKFIKENKEATYISFVTLPSYILLLFRKRIKGKIITAVRNDPKQMHKSLLDKLLVRTLYHKSDAFIFQTNEAKNYYIGMGIDIKKQAILPNPVTEKFLKEPYVGEREKIIVNVGRLIPQKNQKLLINAFKIVKTCYPEYKLYIYGVGKLENKLNRLIQELQLQDSVLLKGNCKSLEDELYNKKMFVLSSDFEGMPNALIEAMSLGVPSISTDCSGGGARELLADNRGILVGFGDEKELANAMIKLIENEELCSMYSNNAYDYCKKNVPENIIKLWKDYITEVEE